MNIIYNEKKNSFIHIFTLTNTFYSCILISLFIYLFSSFISHSLYNKDIYFYYLIMNPVQKRYKG